MGKFHAHPVGPSGTSPVFSTTDFWWPMNLRMWAVFVFCGVLLAFVQLLAAFAHVSLALLAAVVIGFLVFFFLQFFQLKLDAWWPPLVLAMCASLGGTLLRLLSEQRASLWIAFAPLLALVTSGSITISQRRLAKRCGLCNRRIGGDLALECPRCGLVVCDQSCWDFDHSRCRLCESNRVPIFTPDGRWWDGQFGPRVDFGGCQVCLTPAAEANLRACGKCGRAECKACWDYGNGQCAHCGWMISDLPPRLRMYVPVAAQVPRPGRNVARG